jgi:type II secretory pathway pseudopilin PulG
MLGADSTRQTPLGEHGFTLIETLVAIVTGLVVIGALFMILEVALHQSSRLADYAQASQLGRTAMTRVVDELHSACISSAFKPVQEGSTGSKLIFINAYSEKAEITSGEKTRKDEIVWNEKEQWLTDYVFQSNGGSWPEFKFASEATPKSGKRIGETISRAELENNESKVVEKPPLFRYYDYATKPSAGASEPLSTLTEAKPPEKGFTAAEAEKVASVQVSFRTGPPSGSKVSDRSVDLTGQVTFAFTAARSEATIQDAPCQ